MNHDAASAARDFSRREFIATTTAAGAVLVAAPTLLAQAPAPRKRYAQVGVGSQAQMYQDAVNKTYAEHCEMVGYCDNNAGRLKLVQERTREQTGRDVPLYDAKDFERMIREQKPEIVIVMPCGYEAEIAHREAEMHREQLQSLGAATIVAVDASAYFSRPGPRLIDGLELLAHILHSDLISEPMDPHARALPVTFS